MRTSPNPSGRIVVVDRDPSDALELFRTMPDAMPAVCFLPDATSAIQTPPKRGDLLWLINSRLPDIAGCELFEMLRDRFYGVPVVIVANHYSVEDEATACRAGATLYVCKPLDAHVVRACLGRGASPVRGDPGKWEPPIQLNETLNPTTAIR